MRYWGLGKVSIQVLVTCIVVTCKKIAKLASSLSLQEGNWVVNLDEIV